MKRNFLIFLALLIIGIPASVKAEMTGKEILLEQKKRQYVKSEWSTQIMILMDKRNNRKKRIMKYFSKKFDDGLGKSLFVFMEPAYIKGAALLSWEQNERADDQWLYTPSTKKTQRIAAGSRKSYFMGTDFTYEDLQLEDIDNFNYTILRSEKIDGDDTWVIEAVPANDAIKKNSGYSKRHLWIRKDIFFTIKIDFFDRREHLLKSQIIHDLVNIEGTVWRAKKTLMDNKNIKRKTLVGVKKHAINVEISDSLFTRQHLKTGKYTE